MQNKKKEKLQERINEQFPIFFQDFNDIVFKCLKQFV